VQAISDVITRPQEVNMDFANVKTLMQNSGEALMGIGEFSGHDRAIKAAQRAISSPLLENVSIDGARGLLVNISGKRRSVTMHEVRDAMNHIYSVVSPDAKVFGGLGSESSLDNSIRITVIATGFPPQKMTSSGLGRDRRPVFHERRRATDQRPSQGGEKPNPVPDSHGPLDLRRPAYLRRGTSKLN